MKKKMVGILVCMLLIVTALPVMGMIECKRVEIINREYNEIPAITADKDIDVRMRGGILNCKIRMRNYDDKTHTLQCYINATSGNYYKEFSIPAGEYWHYGVGYARSSFGNITATVTENGKILATRSGMIFFGIIIFTIV